MISPGLCLLTTALALGLSITTLAEEKPSTPAPAAGEPIKQVPIIPIYPAVEAAKHIGEDVTVSGTIVAVATSKQGNIYLNFGDRFPKQTFSGVVHSKDAEKIGDVKKFDGKWVTITGKIERYNDKPQIVISSPEQIRIVEEVGNASGTSPTPAKP